MDWALLSIMLDIKIKEFPKGNSTKNHLKITKINLKRASP